MQKVAFFQKLGLALGLGYVLGLAFQGVILPFSTNQMVSKVGKVIQEKFLENVLGPKGAKSGLFSKGRVSVRVGVRGRVSFARCEMTTFDEPDGVQGWESESRRTFCKRFGPKVCKKWTVFKS